MNYNFDNMDYEDLDDLALSEHIEYNHSEAEKFTMGAMNEEYE